ncbi:MAG: serine hydrolase, partial [Candidatus Latescibacterota bacterium]
MPIQIRRFVCLSLIIWFVAGVMSCGDDGSPVDSHNGQPPGDVSLIDSTYLDSLVMAIDNGDYGQVHSVLIHRRDSLVFERYFNGFYRNRFETVYSVTKSVTSALIGIAIDRGDIASVDEIALDYFDYYPSIANLDTRKESINIEHLLTMTAGFEWDEWTLPYSHPDNDIAHMYNSSDWVKYVLDLPMTHTPGTQFVYNSGVSMLLSAILTIATGQSAADYAATHLFGRIGVTQWSWADAPENPGMSIGGWGIRTRPIDMVAFGCLYLNRGRWGDDQIV